MRRAGTQGESLSEYGDLMLPSEAQEPILARPVRGALLEWLTEIWAGEELAEANMRPRSRAIFYGAPGTGKTTLAHHLAARLGLPMVAIRPDRVVDCWLGSSGRNLGAMFDLARSDPDGEGPVVLFFDEFDSLGAKREHGMQSGAQEERNANLNILLQRIDAHDGIIIAATNHRTQIDPALWRRFDIHIELATPGQEERERILSRYLAPWGLPPEALSSLATATETASPAILRQLCEGMKRSFVLGPRLNWDMRRDQTIDRLIATIEPHASLGKPRLWSLGARDQAVKTMPWPLPLATDIPAVAGDQSAQQETTVIPLRGTAPSRPTL